MILSVTVINDREESLTMVLTDPWASGLAITDIDGIGGPDGDIQTSEIVSSDGSLFNNARAKDRKITLRLRPVAKPDIETSRQLTYKYFPVKGHITLIFETDHRVLEIDGYVRSNAPTIFAKTEEIVIEIDCPQPWFRRSGSPVNTVLTGVEPMFEFPFSNEDCENRSEIWTTDEVTYEWDEFGRVIAEHHTTIWHERIYDDRDYEAPGYLSNGEYGIIHHSNDLDLTNNLLIMGDIRQDLQTLITYEGEAPTGFIMQIHAALGPATNINVFNINTGEIFKIRTAEIQAITGRQFDFGDTIYISTVSGNKYARLFRGGQWHNIINAIDKNSDWLILRPGPNYFGYSAAEHEENLSFEIDYTPLYQGV